MEGMDLMLSTGMDVLAGRKKKAKLITTKPVNGCFLSLSHLTSLDMRAIIFGWKNVAH